MKTQKNYLVLLMFLSLTLTFASCKKSLDTPPVINTNVVSGDQTTGSIMDFGLIDTTLHHMIVTLNDVSVSMYGQPMGATTASSKVEIDLYTNSDAYVQDGTYSFSGSNELTPFVFKSATITMPNPDTYSNDTFVLAGGAISLTRTKTSYAITFDGTMENGNSLQGSFNGELSYMDLLATSKKK